MATQLLILPEAALTIRYRQPYISQSLNAKFQSIVAPGVYAGLALTPTSAAQTVQLGVGSASVISSLDAQYQVSVQITGAQSLNLSTLAGATVAIVLEAAYNFPTTTTAEVRAYNLSASETIPAYACVLGEVDIPASGAIPTSSIRLTGRTMPWSSRDRASVPFVNALKNGNFMLGDGPSATTPAFWYAQDSGGSFALNSTTGPSGYGQSVVATAAVGVNNTTLTQYLGVLLTPDRDRVRLRLAYKPTVLSPSIGNPSFKLSLVAPGTGTAIGTLEVPLTATSTTAFTQYEELYEISNQYTIPAAGILVSNAVLTFNGATYATSGAAFSVADIQVEVEAASGTAQTLADGAGEQRTSTLTLVDSASLYGDGKRTKLIYSGTADTLTFSASANLTVIIPNLSVSGSLNVGAVAAPTIRAALVDSLTSPTTTLNIGTSTQTALTMGRVAAPSTLYGSTISLYGSPITLGASATTTTVGGSLEVANGVTVNRATAGVGLTVRAHSSGSAALQEWRDSAGTNVLASITYDGRFYIGGHTALSQAYLDNQRAGVLFIGSTNATIVAIRKHTTINPQNNTLSLQVYGNPINSLDLTQWLAHDGTDPLARITKDGNLTVAASIDRQTAGTLTIGGTATVSVPTSVVIAKDLTSGGAILTLKRTTASATSGSILEALDEDDAVLAKISASGVVTLSTPLAVSSGGTGNSTGDAAGGVAYFDTTNTRIDYTQARQGPPDFEPASGYLLSSNASGAPTWIAPGTAGNVLTSTGTAWESRAPKYFSENITDVSVSGGTYYSGWTDIAALTAISLDKGITHIYLRPRNTESSNEEAVFMTFTDQQALYYAYLPIAVIGPINRHFPYKYYIKTPGAFQDQYTPLAFPSVTTELSAGTYTVKVQAKVNAISTFGIAIEKCVLVVTQG